MKFLEFMNFYPAYLQDFYLRRRNLLQAPFDEQIKNLIADGFSGAHVFAPAMRAHGYEPHFAVNNCAPAQLAWARECGMRTVSNAADVVIHQINTIQPDVLYIADPTALDPRLIRHCSWKPRLTIVWRAAPIPEGADWSDVDVHVSSHKGCREQALRLGARATEFFRPGFPEFVADAVADEDKVWDVVFVGQVGQQHRKRTEYLQALCRTQEVVDGTWKVGLFIPNEPRSLPPELAAYARPSQWGMDMYRTLRRGRICLNVHIDMAGSESQNMRVFECTGVGSLLLTDHGDNIAEIFEPGEEIDSFRDKEEMTQKIGYYLENSEKRDTTALSGQKRCLREHSLAARSRELDSIIRKHLPDRASI